MDGANLGLSISKYWTVFIVLLATYCVIYEKCSAESDPKNYLINNYNKEQASRSYYPSNFKRFRRGYGGVDEPESDTFGQQLQQNSGQAHFGTYQKSGNGGGQFKKGGSRGFGVKPAFGGPDAFLSAVHSEDEEPEDEPAKYGYQSKSGFSSMASSGKGWKNNFNSGRGKGGGGISSIGNKKKKVLGSYGFGSDNRMNRGKGKANMFSKSGNSSPFGSSGLSVSGGSNPNFGGNSNSRHVLTGNQFQPKSSRSGNFPNPFGGGPEPENFNPEKKIIFGSKKDFNRFSGKIEDLTGGNILGSLGNLKQEDLTRLLKQLELATTTKKPNRIILEEDKDKIFSGGQNNDHNGFHGMGRLAAMKMPKANQKGMSPVTEEYLLEECQEPPTAINARVRCTSNAECKLDCMQYYKTPSGSTSVFLRCIDGAWFEASNFADVPNCEPICDPTCKNDGICLSPNVCSCSDQWEGPTCGQPKQTDFMKCSNKPPTPMNSRIFCSTDECVARCNAGYEFEDGVSRRSFECKMGNWEVKNDIGGVEPNCKAVCQDACMNGGICIAPDVCECSSDFRGTECQYPISNCDPLKLKFNGGHNCTGEGMDFGCKFWCPKGVKFTFPASDFYTCDYSSGRWTPSTVPECDYGFLKFQEYQHIHQTTTTEVLLPKPGICFTWSNSHYKTFDGDVYSFQSSCTYTLLQDTILGTFTVNLAPEEGCMGPQCRKKLNIFTEGDQYTLTAEADHPILTFRESSLAIPGQINDLVSERISHFVILKFTAIGLTIKWDLQNLFILEVSESLWNRTRGLCGRHDGTKDNDISEDGNSSSTNLISFLGTCQADNLLEQCSEYPIIAPKCSERRRTSGKKFCSKLKEDNKFQQCRKMLDVDDYVRTCEWDYCICTAESPEECACQSIAAFVKDCTASGESANGSWRSDQFCPMNCKKGFEYKTCLPVVQPRCGQPSDSAEPEFCIEGCDCPSGTVKYDGGCISPEKCPCTYHNKTYSAWDVIPNDCNTCTCISGKWACTEVRCGARCSVVGDPHYKTFDGRRFDFMGRCSYYLVKGDGFSIEAENVPCAGAISEGMNFPESLVSGFPSCTKSVTIRVPETTIQLKQNGFTTVNGIEVTDLPIYEGDIYVKKASSLFTLAILPNLMEVWWDGQNRVYVDAPAEMRTKTSGLCGTFNDNQKDDFLTPETDIEQNPVSFANKWKTIEKCPDNRLIEQSHPCERHIQRKEISEKYCTRLKSRIFSKCHFEVDPDAYYRNCLYDMCSCDKKLGDCLCPIMASYGKECTDKGIAIDWRSQYRECGLHCNAGQKYQNCGDSCTYTCHDIASNPDCKRKCVEGCACSEGFSLDADGKCIPISQCPCLHEGKEYKTGYEMMQNGEETKICKCRKAQWDCRMPTDIEMNSPEFFVFPQVQCLADSHEIYTDCVPGEEINCKNMHLRPELPPDTCRAGCVCNIGFVRNVDSGLCVKPTNCPCHHGGKSYQENEQIIEECNTCTCNGGIWGCTTEDCPASCTAWGDSHFKTFDGKIYDFHGICDYMLAKGKISKTDSFEVTIQNIPCGTNGVTCAKSISLRIGYGDQQEVITFSKNKPIRERNLTRTIIREVGSFVFAEVADMGLVLQWDKGTIAYVILRPSWKNKVKGLCGNYNEDEKDDFQTPSGGVTEESAKVFGDSWRLQNRCPESGIVQDTCVIHPHRKLWSLRKCAILQSDVFSPCHSEVPVEPYLERCQFDACGCDMGGDCHCLCTAIAAYAQECNVYGAPIRWRRPDFCPMQCDESCKTYQPCVSACPVENCESDFSQRQSLCQLETCIEGCSKQVCLPGEVHTSPTNFDCIPKSYCNKTCMIIDEKIYHDGDIISEDDCHSCFCMNHKEVCKGVPCTVTSPTVTSSFHISTPPSIPEYSPVVAEFDDCRSGWSNWLNNDRPLAYSKNSDIEEIPWNLPKVVGIKGFCQKDMMVDIQCRSIGHHQPPPPSVDCNLEDGLKCVGPKSHGKGSSTCKDYEISVLCDCTAAQTFWNVSTISTALFPTKGPESDHLPYSCDTNGWSSWVNTQSPTSEGEYETIEQLRNTISMCPDQYIMDVECRPVRGPSNQGTSCDKKGAICSNNGRKPGICTDYEIRVLCHCECQDGINIQLEHEIASYDLPFSSASSHRVSEHDKLKGTSKWVPAERTFNKILDEDYYGTEWLQVDLGKQLQITGVLTQGFLGGFVSKFSIKISSDDIFWDDVHIAGETSAYSFKGNNDSHSIVRNIFPSSVIARYIKILPIEYKLIPALRIKLTGCDEEITLVTESTTIRHLESTTDICTTGWTSWINTNTPSPKNWNDIESYENIRQVYPLCDDRAITKVECRVAGVHTSVKDAGQYDVSCNKNQGLQCSDELQTWHCYDYEIRFYCDCGFMMPTIGPTSTVSSDVEMLCKPGDINVQHDTNCQKFFKCDLNNKNKPMVEETCGPGTLYNPQFSICDFPYSVYKVRPECKDLPTTTLPVITTEKAVECSNHYWTTWFNVSHPDKDGGDYETHGAISAAGLDICSKEYIMDVECQYEAKVRKSHGKGKGAKGSPRKGKHSKGRHSSTLVAELQDYTKSRDYDVTCTTDGLSCDNYLQPKWRGGSCQDYSVRFLCSCKSKETAQTTTLPSHTTSPVDDYTDFRSSLQTTTPFMLNDYACPSGAYYEEFALRCTQICIFYRQLLVQHGKCLDDDEKAPACVDEVSQQACPSGLLLRDKSTCVNIFDCNCMLSNGISAPPGKALLVSDCEICQCQNNDLICDNSKCFGKPKEYSCDEWGPWMSISTPYGEGDDESLVKMRTNNPHICWNPKRIECRDKKSGLSADRLGQNVICDTSVGLLCYNWQNLEMCKDYEVRIICPCSEDQEEPTGVVKPKTECDNYFSNVVDCGAQCEEFCNDQESSLQQQGYCKAKYDCVPTCLLYGKSKLCSEDQFISANWTCVPASKCNCKLKDGRTVEAGKMVHVSKCEACKCTENTLQCEPIPNCLETDSETAHKTTSVFAPEGAPPTDGAFTHLSTAMPPGRSLVILKCDDWTPWMNIKRTYDGDFQKLSDLRNQYDGLCGTPANISCRETNSKLPAEQLSQDFICDPKVGFVCRNSDNRERCHDYEVSFFCKCQESLELTTKQTTKGYGLTTESIPCVAWSPWINENRPDDWGSDGDTEDKTISRLREEYEFCKNGEITNIECLEAKSGLPISASRNVRCDKNYGLRCRNRDQKGGTCLDFKIRYYCSCESSVTTRPTILLPLTVPPSSVCEPSSYTNLLDDVRDSGFSATSDKSSLYSAADARLNNAQHSSGGVWIPANSDVDQFLQIDFGEQRVIYGLLIGGSVIAKGRVTTYSVQISNDELYWSFVEPKVLYGPASNKETHTTLFEHPVEARFIKILPLTWNKLIALRVEAIGCSAVAVTPIVITQGPLICYDEMGISNGLLKDSQFSVSSVFNDQVQFYGKGNIRLNSTAGGGAWIAKNFAERATEFVYIDFLQPTKITGIKTQGRNSRQEWVESFIIKYSPDEQIWSTIKDDSTGNDKIFMGNYDSDSIVVILFDRVIETRYLKIVPYSWKERIALRLEIIGCFQPYPEHFTTEVSFKPTVTPPVDCDACPSLPPELYSRCRSCFDGQKFDGKDCIPELLCPCYYDGKPFTLGVEFETADCKQCTCDLMGISTCEPIQCHPCEEKNERPITTAFCKCLCKPCPENTRLCPSNNFCLDETKWCDGITNCPDDEVNCPTKPPFLPSECPTANCPTDWEVEIQSSKSKIRCPPYECKPPITTTLLPCQPPICPMEYIIVMEQLQEEGVCPKYNCVLPASTKAPHSCPSPSCPSGYEPESSESFEQISQFSDYDYDKEVCPKFRCVTKVPPTAPCPPPNCPSGYNIEYGDRENMMKLCPIYECIPKLTTTMCPPISCPHGLQTMYTESDDVCPQYNCIRVTTAIFPPEMSTMASCPKVILPICEPGEEIYQTNPTENCPLFKCKTIGSQPSTTEESIEPETSTCRIEGKGLTTFDGLDLYDIWACNHILARNKVTKKWKLSIHQNCSTDRKPCSLFIRIAQEDQIIDLLSDLSVSWNGHIYTAQQANMIGSASSQFTIFHVGDCLIFSSAIYNFTIIWDTDQSIKIELNENSIYQVDGLCGQFTGHEADDLSTPTGQIAISKKEYQEAWLDDDKKCVETTDKCSKEESADAFEMCNIVKTDTFEDCHDVLPPMTFVQGCIERMCACAKKDKSEEDCHCSIISTYVQSCLEKKPSAKLANWRIETKCYKECSAGEEYHDCYSYACEQSCSTVHSPRRCTDIPKMSCISGCFCEPGLVRRKDKCVLPERCKDCVCENYGNSHYVTYDRFNYSLVSQCSHVLTRDLNPSELNSFQIKIENGRCTDHSWCTKNVTILLTNHELELNDAGSKMQIIFDGIEVVQFPAKKSQAVIEKLNANHASVFVDELQLEVTFTLDNHGLVVRVPSSIYSGRLQGLCGNCNFDMEDDLLTRKGILSDTVEEFAESWITSDNCEAPAELKKCPTLLPENDPCYKIMEKAIFGKCHPIEDPMSYLIACQMDYCNLASFENANCQTFEAYARRCSQMGVCLDWRSSELCQKNCSEGLKYLACGSGCTKTCDNFEEMENHPEECTLSAIDGCFCEDGKVKDNEECITKEACIVCDSDGHRGGDVWKTDPCTTCECSPTKGGIICNTKACPPAPICGIGFILTEEQNMTDECCGPKKICELKPTEACPAIDKPAEECPFGKHYKLVHFPEIPCPDYICVCLERSNCPKVLTPSDDDLLDGEAWDLDTNGCCDVFVKTCTYQCAVLDCQRFYILKERPTSEKRCCPDTFCAPPEDSCIYEKDNNVDFIVQSEASDLSNVELHKIGEQWQDGSCTSCECVKDHTNTPHAKCITKTCPTIETHPDRKEYELDESFLNGICCPEVTRSACIEDGDIVQVNDTYYDPINGCRSVECKTSSEGRIEKVEQMFSCSHDCPLGWEYQESALYPQVCCGDCQQVACEHEGNIKNVDDIWQSNDFCTEYKCESNHGKLKIHTKQKLCHDPTVEEEAKYVYNETIVDKECCIKYDITACIANDVTLSVGFEIPDVEDSCIIYSCEYRGNTIARKEKEKSCITECPLGNIYVNPKHNSKECCGTCMQTQCVDNKELHPVGDTWENPNDKCFEYTCQIRDGTLTTVAIRRECPYFDPDCPQDKIIKDPCCTICNVTRETKKECQPEEIPMEETVGMFVLEASQVGKCTNYEPVSGFQKCNGQCDSGTVFIAEGTSASHESECDCCKPSHFSQVKVPLKCEQGYTFDRIFVNIEACECQKCEPKKNFYNDQPAADDETLFHVPFEQNDETS